MKLLQRIFGSSVGKKFIMAISGCGLFLFVVLHMLGNLQLFLGPAALNRYAHFLQTTPELLWPVRIGLLVLVGLHIWSASALTLENRASRPIPYAHGQPPYAASYASRTMFVSGLIVAAFIVFHLLHYTVCVRALNFTGKDFAHLTDPRTGYHDVFAMVVYGFSVWYVSLFYIVGVGLLCLHLSHGISALFQSLGLRNPAWWPILRKFALIAAVVLFLGFISVPAAVMLGYGRSYVNGLQSGAQPAAVMEAK